MKRVTLLLLGLFVAGLAAWAVPREYKATKEPMKIEWNKAIPSAVVEAITVNQEFTVEAAAMHSEDASIKNLETITEGLSSKFRWQRTATYLYSYNFNNKPGNIAFSNAVKVTLRQVHRC